MSLPVEAGISRSSSEETADRRPIRHGLYRPQESRTFGIRRVASESSPVVSVEELKKETSLKNIKDYNDKSFHQAVLSIGPAPFDIVDKYLPAYYEYIE